jgi:hypothetical protein
MKGKLPAWKDPLKVECQVCKKYVHIWFAHAVTSFPYGWACYRHWPLWYRNKLKKLDEAAGERNAKMMVELCRT